jgi:predicted MFS family arabinose efflux permease
LHGPTFSAFWIAGVVYAGQIAPAGLGASAQAALGAVLFGLSKGAGALLGASLYDSVGPPATFRVAAGLALASLVVLGSARFRRRRLA